MITYPNDLINMEPNSKMNNKTGCLEDCHGLTKREYFAAMLMQGILASYSTTDTMMGATRAAISEEISVAELTARNAVGAADFLITELNKEVKNENQS